MESKAIRNEEDEKIPLCWRKMIKNRRRERERGREAVVENLSEISLAL
jgi:hypothetical protein